MMTLKRTKIYGLIFIGIMIIICLAAAIYSFVTGHVVSGSIFSALAIITVTTGAYSIYKYNDSPW